MERNEFFPRPAPLSEGGGRDLPPHDRYPLMPEPRLEQSVDRGNGNGGGHGCGCNGGNGHGQGNAPNDGACGDSHANGSCVGFEGCGPNSWGLDGYPTAMVFAPCQGYHALYDPPTALSRGTLFTELDLPLGQADGGFTTVGCACRAERRGL